MSSFGLALAMRHGTNPNLHDRIIEAPEMWSQDLVPLVSFLQRSAMAGPDNRCVCQDAFIELLGRGLDYERTNPSNCFPGLP